MIKSDSINDLAAALATAQGKIRNAGKDRENPHYRSKYADLASCWDACREPLAAHGLAIVQLPALMDGAVSVETLLTHASGQWVSSTLIVPLSKSDAQGVGSALTYARRYGLCAMVGIAPAEDDDDGSAAIGQVKKPSASSAMLQVQIRTVSEIAERSKAGKKFLIFSVTGYLPDGSDYTGDCIAAVGADGSQSSERHDVAVRNIGQVVYVFDRVGKNGNRIIEQIKEA